MVDRLPPVNGHVGAEGPDGIALAELIGHAMFSAAFSTGIPFALTVMRGGPTTIFDDYGQCFAYFSSTADCLVAFVAGSVVGAVVHWMPLRAIAAWSGHRSFLVLASVSLALQSISLIAFLAIWQECSIARVWPFFAGATVVGALAAAAVAYRFLSTRAETA